VRLSLRDALGRTVATLHDGPAPTDLTLSVETARLAAGVYAVIAEVDDEVLTRRFTVVR
jgi:hypothetical protein